MSKFRLSLSGVMLGALVATMCSVGASAATNSTSSNLTPAPQSVVNEITQVPLSVSNQVGTNSSTAVSAPVAVAHLKPLNWANAQGVHLPTVYYYGAEYCPFCAAQRWPLIVALSRFGTFTGLGEISSSSADYAPNTPTFSFVHATYTSKYITFDSVESTTNVVDPKTGTWYPLQTPTNAELKNLNKYDAPQYISDISEAGSIPYITFNDHYFAGGASFSPLIMAGSTQSEIAGSLDDPSNLITQAILATANELTAAICDSTGQQPANVCSAAGTKAGDKADGITKLSETGSGSSGVLSSSTGSNTSSLPSWFPALLAPLVLVAIAVGAVVVTRRRRRTPDEPEVPTNAL
jgi:hypothetical protein